MLPAPRLASGKELCSHGDKSNVLSFSTKFLRKEITVKRTPLTLILSLILTSAAHAAAPVNSASRAPGESYLNKILTFSTPTFSDSAMSRMAPLAVADMSLVPEWKDEQLILEGFMKVRDERSLYSTSSSTFKRRSSWFYPDDGCFDRAQIMGSWLETMGYVRPAKIFAFGNLEVSTVNSPAGSVSWWYHVVPIARVGTRYFVFDPAIEPDFALDLNDWLAKMAKDPSTINVSVCTPYTYGPGDLCTSGTSAADDAQAFADQPYYLDAEWYRVETELKRDANEELGDHPVWRH